MPVRDTAAHLRAAASDEPREAGDQLQPTLIELTKRSPFGKQLDRSVVSAHLRPFHEQLDGFAESWPELAHTVAERPVGIGRRTLRNSDSNGSAPSP
jgi:DNA-binding ferritin-like protein